MLLPQAVKEVAALAPDAYERAVAEPVLLNLQHVLAQAPSRTPDEQEFIMTMYKTWEEGRIEARTEGRTEGRAEGRAEGLTQGRAEARTETQANAVLTVLRVRGIAVPDAARTHILAQKDLQRLERWLEKATVATSIGEVIDDPS